MTKDPAAPDPADASQQLGDEQSRDVIEVGGERRRAARSFGGTAAARWIAAFLGLAALIALQVAILQRLGDSNDELDATRAAVTGLQVDLRTANDRVDDIDTRIGTIEEVFAAAGSSQGNPVSVQPGALPPFTQTENDAAVVEGYVLGDVTGVEYYSNQSATFGPSDGTARLWLVWAHWCPYCQEELPALAAWWPQNADRFPNAELVTVSSSMDEARGNPLLPYLDESQFPFPVIMDPDLQLAQQLGTNAFPFWVVTDGDGTVLLRLAGAIGIDTVEAILTQIESVSNT